MSQRIPTLCFHQHTGRFYVRLCGKSYYLGCDKALAQTKADRLIGEWLAGGRNAPEPVPTHDLTIAELVNQYRHYAESYYRRPDGSPSGHLSVVKSAMRLLRQYYGAAQAAAFGPLALRALRERMIEAGLSRFYINGQVHRVRLAFKWAVGRELLPIETFQRLLTVEGLRRGRSEARDPDPIGPVDDATVEATLVFLNPTLADMVRIQDLTGMRPDEVLLMRSCDIDRSDDVWVFTPAHHKTQHHGHERRVSLGPKCQAVLRKYVLRAPDAYLFSPAEVTENVRDRRRVGRKTPESCGNRPGTNRKRAPRLRPGTCYTPRSYARAITRAAKLADVQAHREHPESPIQSRLIPHWHPNQLRHGRATELRKQFGLEAVAATLGHARMQTSEIYAEKNFELAKRVAREVG